MQRVGRQVKSHPFFDLYDNTVLVRVTNKLTKENYDLERSGLGLF